VNDASQIVFKAAHPDANIIFGAVVDPALENRVKITVIATGFGDGSGGKSNAPTPVDIQNYDSWYNKRHEQPAAAAQGGSATGSIAVRRRTSIAVPAQARAVVNGSPIDPGADGEEGQQLDVPAFMRQKN